MEDVRLVKITYIMALLSLLSILVIHSCKMEKKNLEVIDKEIMNETKVRGGDV